MSRITEFLRHRDQRNLIKAELLAGKVVTQQTAAVKHRVWRLSAVIERIRRLDGWPVQTLIDPRDGHALYSLPQGWTPPEHRSKPDQGTGPAYDIGGAPEVLNGDTLDEDGEAL